MTTRGFLMPGETMIEVEPVARRPRTRLVRPTEGSQKTGAVSRTRNLSGEKRGRGRPSGSKNKPKSLIPTELADSILLQMEGAIPAEHYDYLKGVIKRGDAISTKRELDVLILLLNRNIWPALMAETKTGEDFDDDPTDDADLKKKYDGPIFRKDVTERLKVLSSLLNLRNQIDKNEDSGKDGEQPLIKIVADRNLLAGGRIAVLVGGVPDRVVGDSDGTGRPALPPRTVSSPLPE